MKNPDIQPLLERYREGSLSDSERDELNRLAGRDAVLFAASRRADGIRRRRRTALFTTAGLLLVGTAVWTFLPRQESPLMAEAIVPEAVMPAEPAAVEQPAPAEPAASQTAPAHTSSRPASLQPRQAAAAKTDDETIVICNNQCEADSVISDIWKFLTV